LVAHACNPSHLGGWDREDYGLSPARVNSSGDSFSKTIKAKWTGGVAQIVEHLLCKGKALNSNHSPIKTKKQTKKSYRAIVTKIPCYCHKNRHEDQ
jgi:hypothetical protein